MILDGMDGTYWGIVDWLDALIGPGVGDGKWRVAGKRRENGPDPSSIFKVSVLVGVLPETHYK